MITQCSVSPALSDVCHSVGCDHMIALCQFPIAVLYLLVCNGKNLSSLNTRGHMQLNVNRQTAKCEVLQNK